MKMIKLGNTYISPAHIVRITKGYTMTRASLSVAVYEANGEGCTVHTSDGVSHIVRNLTPEQVIEQCN